MNNRHQILCTGIALWLCVGVACGDDDSSDTEPEDSISNGEWICYDYSNECLCHVSKGGESPSTATQVIDRCVGLTCCVSYQDSYGSRCDCRNVRTDLCQNQTEGKTNATVVTQCPP